MRKLLQINIPSKKRKNDWLVSFEALLPLEIPEIKLCVSILRVEESVYRDLSLADNEDYRKVYGVLFESSPAVISRIIDVLKPLDIRQSAKYLNALLIHSIYLLEYMDVINFKKFAFCFFFENLINPGQLTRWYRAIPGDKKEYLKECLKSWKRTFESQIWYHDGPESLKFLLEVNLIRSDADCLTVTDKINIANTLSGYIHDYEKIYEVQDLLVEFLKSIPFVYLGKIKKNLQGVMLLAHLDEINFGQYVCQVVLEGRYEPAPEYLQAHPVTPELAYKTLLEYLENYQQFRPYPTVKTNRLGGLVNLLEPATIAREFDKIRALASQCSSSDAPLFAALVSRADSSLTSRQVNTIVRELGLPLNRFDMEALPIYITKMDAKYFFQVLTLVKHTDFLKGFIPVLARAFIDLVPKISGDTIFQLYLWMAEMNEDFYPTLGLLIQGLNQQQQVELKNYLLLSYRKDLEPNYQALIALKLLSRNHEDDQQEIHGLICQEASRLLEQLAAAEPSPYIGDQYFHAFRILHGMSDTTEILRPHVRKMVELNGFLLLNNDQRHEEFCEFIDNYLTDPEVIIFLLYYLLDQSKEWPTVLKEIEF